MDVTGITAAKAQEIADASIVSAYVNGSKQLVIVNGAGAESVAGQIDDFPPQSWNPDFTYASGGPLTGSDYLAQYIRIGDHVSFTLKWTGSASTGIMSHFKLPVPLPNYDNQFVATGWMYTSGSIRRAVHACATSSTTAAFYGSVLTITGGGTDGYESIDPINAVAGSGSWGSIMGSYVVI